MNVEILTLGKDDQVIVSHNIGNMPPQDVDAYCEKLLPKLTEIFGEKRVALFPVRDGETWEFTIIRKI